eukprot:2934650-Rhodomonas_salina.1
MRLFNCEKGVELSPNGWTAGVEKFRGYQGQLSAARLLRDAAQAKSTLSLLREDADRGLIGEVMGRRGKGALPIQAQ